MKPGSKLPAGRSSAKLLGSLRGVGYLNYCQGSYYWFYGLSATDKDTKYVQKDKWGMNYKQFLTGPAMNQTHGSWAIDASTGTGMVSG